MPPLALGYFNRLKVILKHTARRITRTPQKTSTGVSGVSKISGENPFSSRCQEGEGREILPGFLVDGMLGRLARWLRVLGYDTWYFRNRPDEDLLKLPRCSGRILVTRDRGLIRRWEVGRGLWIVHDRWEKQVEQLLEELDVPVCRERWFTRCLRCNSTLQELARGDVQGKVAEYIVESHRTFRGCPTCGRVYWPGTHRSDMSRRLDRFQSRNRVVSKGT
jgi:uncharacterized protein